VGAYGMVGTTKLSTFCREGELRNLGVHRFEERAADHYCREVHRLPVGRNPDGLERDVRITSDLSRLVLADGRATRRQARQSRGLQ